MLTLVRMTGPRKNEKIRLEHTRVRLGRAKANQVRFHRERERVVSNYHAEIRAEDGGYVLYDLQSTHGTYVNNERISRRRLQEGDVIGLALQMGGPTLRFSQRESERLLSELQARQEISHTGATGAFSSVGAGSATRTSPAPDALEENRQDQPLPRHQEGQEASEEGAREEEHWAAPELPTSWSPLPSDAEPGLDVQPGEQSAEPGLEVQPSSQDAYAGYAAGVSDGVPTVGESPKPGLSTSSPAGYDDEATSAFQPPGVVTKSAPVPASKMDMAFAEGKRVLARVKAAVTPMFERIKPAKHQAGDEAPAPGALLDPHAGSISFGTRLASVARCAGRLVWSAGRKVVSRRPKRPATTKKARSRKERRKSSPRKSPEAVRPQGRAEYPVGTARTPRLTKPFVLEEALKEPPRADWIWMQKHRWFLRFLIVAVALSWWYQDEIFDRFHQYYGEPVPMVQGEPPDAPLAEPAGTKNTLFFELTRQLYEATKAREMIRRSDGNRELRALRPVLWKAGEESRLVPVDFLDDVSKAIDKVRSDQDFTIVYARSTKHRPQLVHMLEACNLPEIMSFIPWIESGYLPSFQDSQTGRVGLWGLDVETARRHGLTVSKRRDDRLDWKLSTQAACSYLTELVGELRGLSFTLAVAAYEEGPVGIRRMLAQREAWKRDQVNLWYMYREDYIPQRMFDYLTRVLAVASVAETPEAYHLPPLEIE